MKIPTTANISDLTGEEIMLLRDGVEGATTSIPMRGINAGGTKGTAATSMVLSALGINNVTKVILPHSGFQLSIGVIAGKDKLIILDNVTNAINSSDISTLGVVNSASDGVLVAILMDILPRYIIASTLDVSNDKVINYIDFRDAEIIKMAVLSAMAIGETSVDIECVECKTTKQHIFNVKDIIWYNPSKLISNPEDEPNEDINDGNKDFPDGYDGNATLTKISNNSITLKQFFDYRKQTSPKISKPINDVVSIIFGSRTISKYLDDTALYEQSIIATLDGILLELDSKEIDIVEEKENIKQASLVGSYLPYVEAITVKQGGKTIRVTDRLAILNTLNSLITQPEYALKVVTAANEAIKQLTIGYVGVLPYVCEGCGLDIPEDKPDDETINVIPLSGTQYFLDRSTHVREEILASM